MNKFILVQIFGAVTLIIFVVSLQQRKKEHFLLLQMGGTVIFVAQYILTGKMTGALLFSIVAIRGLVFYCFKKKSLKPSLIVLAIFQAALLVSTILTWENALSIIPFIATTAKTWGTWQDDMKWTRRTSLIGQSCMIAYNLAASNLAASMYTGALTEACNLVSTGIAVWRYDLHKKTGDNP